MLSIIDLRKKIGIDKKQYRQATLPKKSESAKKIAIGASLVTYILLRSIEIGI